MCCGKWPHNISVFGQRQYFFSGSEQKPHSNGVPQPIFPLGFCSHADAGEVVVWYWNGIWNQLCVLPWGGGFPYQQQQGSNSTSSKRHLVGPHGRGVPLYGGNLGLVWQPPFL